MLKKLLDDKIVGNTEELVDFLENILESSTEYSIIGKDLTGRVLLWNEGARRVYGYEPEEIIGHSSEILYTPEDRQAGLPQKVLTAALNEGKWEGMITRMRQNGERFPARVVLTPRRAATGRPIGFLLISKDVSSEVRLMEELKATQLYTRSLIESNIDALMTTDTLGIITDVNQQMEALTGHSRDKLIGTAFKQFFTDPNRAEEGIRLVLQEGEVTNYELTALSKDGHLTVVSYNASTFRDAQGRLQGVFAAARDITQQKQLEQQIRESEAYNRGLIEASVDGLITVAPDGLIMDVNEQMCRMSGFGREELIGTAFPAYFVDSDLATAGVQETFEKEAVTNYVLTLATRSGQKMRVSFNASIFRDPAGNVRGIFASARDITEQARLQDQLAKERAYNRGLIEASVDGLLVVDPLLVITDVNEQMCRMSGYGRNELIGTPFPEYFTDSKRAVEGVRLTLDKGAVTNYELTLRAKDGGESWVSFNAAIFKDQVGEVRGIFASARDITAQKRAEEEIRQLNEALEQKVRERTAELEVANRELEAFSYSVSHDLKTPIRAIQGFSRMLADEHTAKLDAEGLRLLDIVIANTRLMDKIVDDLLALSRMSRQPMHKSVIDLAALARNTFRQLQPQEPGRDLQLVVQDLPPAFGDPGLIKQVMVNLLANAIKFTQPIKTVHIEVGGKNEKEETVYYIKDNGVGFDMNYAHKLFGLFQTLHNRKKYEGTGLGLAIVQRIIHRHGGRVWAEGKVGEGATFYFALPRNVGWEGE